MVDSSRMLLQGPKICKGNVKSCIMLQKNLNLLSKVMLMDFVGDIEKRMSSTGYMYIIGE